MMFLCFRQSQNDVGKILRREWLFKIILFSCWTKDDVDLWSIFSLISKPDVKTCPPTTHTHTNTKIVSLFCIFLLSFKIKRMSRRYFRRDFRSKMNISVINTFPPPPYLHQETNVKFMRTEGEIPINSVISLYNCKGGIDNPKHENVWKCSFSGSLSPCGTV